SLEGAPGGDGLPAPGHPPARLRAEEPEAGVQARSVRDVRGTARPGEARHGQYSFADQDPERTGPAEDGGAAARDPGTAVQARGGGCPCPTGGGTTVTAGA